ncbi:MAG: hypothetical protein ACR2IF_07180 [Terriglobales bacterium]
MISSAYAVLIDFACALAAALMVVPSVLYLFTEWVSRRDKIFSYLNPDALKLYYEQFLSVDSPPNIQEAFRKRFDRLYGRRRYIPPVIALAIAAGFAAWGVARTIQVWEHIAPANHAMPSIAVSAITGAFAWIVLDQLSRFRKRDFTVTDVYNCVFRLLLAVPFGVAFSKFAAPEIGVPLAFFLGAFPTSTLFTFARRISTQRLGLGDQEQTGLLELERLQCIGRANAERLQDEGINTIAGLAWCDPIDITIRTNFNFTYVIDAMSQALLWVYFEDKVRLVFPCSLRGAQEVCYVLGRIGILTAPPEGVTQADIEAAKNAEKALDCAAAVLDMDKEAMLETLRQVAYDPYTQFLMRVWH